MKSIKKKIVITGGEGRFAKTLKKSNTKLNIFFPNKNELNILNIRSIEKYIKKIKPKFILHAAGLSRPMGIHDKKISKSIDLNIIGTANVVKICEKYNIKLIYFSTNYIYPGKKGNYKEVDTILPINNYAWSKLGGEAAVQMYKKSLILRVCMTERPFIHKRAYANVKSNFIYHENLPKIIMKILNKNGVINLGGRSQTIYNFVKKDLKLIKKKISKGEFPKRQDMNLGKLKKIIKL